MNDKQASCSDPDPGSFYNALHRALSPPKKEETGPNPRKAIVSLEENPMASSPSMPRICQLALITADSQYPHGSKQRLPPARIRRAPAPPCPRQGLQWGWGGGPCLLGQAEGAFGAQRRSLSASALLPGGPGESGFPGQLLPTLRNPTRSLPQCGLSRNPDTHHLGSLGFWTRPSVGGTA